MKPVIWEYLMVFGIFLVFSNLIPLSLGLLNGLSMPKWTWKAINIINQHHMLPQKPSDFLRSFGKDTKIKHKGTMNRNLFFVSFFMEFQHMCLALSNPISSMVRNVICRFYTVHLHQNKMSPSDSRLALYPVKLKISTKKPSMTNNFRAIYSTYVQLKPKENIPQWKTLNNDKNPPNPNTSTVWPLSETFDSSSKNED